MVRQVLRSTAENAGAGYGNGLDCDADLGPDHFILGRREPVGRAHSAGRCVRADSGWCYRMRPSGVARSNTGSNAGAARRKATSLLQIPFGRRPVLAAFTGRNVGMCN